MGNVKVITQVEIEAEEVLWRELHKMLTMTEKIVIANMGEFKDYNMEALLEIKELIKLARLKAYDRWQNVNYAIKHSVTGTLKNQG